MTSGYRSDSGAVENKPQHYRRKEAMSVQRWSEEHSARKAPLGAVLYDDDDDLFTVKIRDGE